MRVHPIDITRIAQIILIWVVTAVLAHDTPAADNALPSGTSLATDVSRATDDLLEAGEPLETDELLTTASEYVSRGMQRFRGNEIVGSIRDFQRAAEIDPQRAPHLWQLGISHYYVGDFKQGRQQFESHQAVNPHDVENAAWHFICVARLEGIEAARETLIKIDTTRDARVPMSEVYQFYRGRGSQDAVIKAAHTADTEVARMYAHLYLSLYYEAAEKAYQASGSEGPGANPPGANPPVSKAQYHMRKAAAARLKNNYMHDVAKVHLLQREWNR